MTFDLSELRDTATGKYVGAVSLGAREVLALIDVVEAAERLVATYCSNGSYEDAIESLNESLGPLGLGLRESD